MHAAAQPWTGDETVSDSALRMLDDAHKPLRDRGPRKIPGPKISLNSVDMRMKKAVQKSQGERLANARDRTSVYALSQDPNLSEQEKEQFRKQLRDRFTPNARHVPSSVQGLAALANERIEDAIARGQFKNLPRGKGKNVEKDYNANSPFLDTTEYFMNKIIQKQEIVPPWIEKQQELVKAANVFRSRLRVDWKRHAARVIASRGGSLQTQIERAETYATSETNNNPSVSKMEAISQINSEGRLSQLTVIEKTTPLNGSVDSQISISEEVSAGAPDMTSIGLSQESTDRNRELSPTASSSRPKAKVDVFRDPAWESLERAYHILSITNLNRLTRSYNLQAPDLAKKPYFSLERELKACFADVAPQLPDEIRKRACTPERIRVKVINHKPGSVLDRFSGEKARVYDERKPQYGFKEFWKDLWGRQGRKAIK